MAALARLSVWPRGSATVSDGDHPIRLLVADDDPAVALMAKMALKDYGYTLHTVESGEAAIEAIAATPPDLVLLDVMMTGISGFDVCRHLRMSGAHQQLPIIMATSLDDSKSIELAYEAGATAFVTKPINWFLLRHQIHYVLRASQDRAALAESEERYALAASGANDGLWDWNIRKNKVYFSPRWREQLGLRERDLNNAMEDWLERVHPDDLLGFRNELNDHLAGRVAKFEIEYRVRDAEDEYHWMLCRALAIRDDDGEAYRMAGSQTDISERKRAEAQLVHDALHDSLTGLANRELLLERITHSIRLAQRRNDYRFAVVVIDLDRFKTINDSLGHLAGDSLLCRIGERIGQHLRTSDTLARTGGDEFAILLDDIGDYADLTRLIERIRREIAQPFPLLTEEVAITASLGIALHDANYSRADDMLRDADIAMYRAKSSGKNRHEMFDTTMHTQIATMLSIENDLRAAISRQELRVYYQPIYRLDDHRVVGFEALLRWQHPTKGLLPPDAYLGIAEESGLIIPIGHWVLREATRQLAHWQETIPQMRDCYVAINLSSTEFAHPDLISQVTKALRDSGLTPDRLKLEMTETVLIENTARANRVLDALHELGVAAAIDDFGTGYSSLSYLHRFNFDVLKIDRSFVERIDREPKSREIVRTIVSLAQNLGLIVIAEGGETDGEIACLREVGCIFSQGYAFSKALAVDEIDQLYH